MFEVGHEYKGKKSSLQKHHSTLLIPTSNLFQIVDTILTTCVGYIWPLSITVPEYSTYITT
jgi:hypothetical protein